MKLSDVKLPILAISAPQWARRPENIKIKSFQSTQPFSLQNAVRKAIHLANTGDPVWSKSNWNFNCDDYDPHSSVILSEFWEADKDKIEFILKRLKPKILLIGAMSICFRGAIEIAILAKKVLGDSCFIVLGGKHVSETFYRDFKQNLVISDTSPLKLLQSNKLLKYQDKHIFDLVVSGEGEDIIVELGRLILENQNSASLALSVLKKNSSLKNAKGNWIAGFTNIENKLETIEPLEKELDFLSIPPASRYFLPSKGFKPFKSTQTGHAYSDMGRGCRFNCFFCSERSGINGRLRYPSQQFSPVARILESLRSVRNQIANNSVSHSAFVEDSIFLSGNSDYISEFISEMLKNPIANFEIGVQFTVNDIDELSSKRWSNTELSILEKLRSVGVNYVALGIETPNEAIARKMSKHKKTKLWSIETASSIETLQKIGFKIGVYVLWGLGETQFDRLSQLRQIREWQTSLGGEPSAISLNWATHHPGNLIKLYTYSEDNRKRFDNIVRKYDYTDWAYNPNSDTLDLAVEIFGEISDHYSVFPNSIPSKPELEDILDMYSQLTN